MKYPARHEIDMCSGAILPKLLLFSIPLMCSSFLQLFFNAADTIVVGRYAGDNSLAAVGANISLISLLVNLFTGLSVGSNILAALLRAAGDTRRPFYFLFLSGLLNVLLNLVREYSFPCPTSPSSRPSILLVKPSLPGALPPPASNPLALR